MNKLKLNLAHEAGEVLSKEDMKKILGGGAGSAATCVCTLTNSQNESVSFNVTFSGIPTAEGCSKFCKDSCYAANANGGNCEDWKYVYTPPTPSETCSGS